MTLTLQPNINLHTLNTVNQTYQPQLLFNDYKQGMKLSYEIIQQLNSCDSFQLSIAFISLSGLATLKQTLLDLQNKNISGKIITSTYLGFNEPKVFKELLKFNNLEIRIYDDPKIGFHPKGYIFKKNDTYNIIIGSSNLTQNALSINQEWNLKLSSTYNNDISKQVLKEFHQQWQNSFPLTNQWINEYSKTYTKQKTETQLRINTKIKPNKMQIAALNALKSIRNENKNKALLISATGTGKTYLSAFDVKAFNPKRMLFVVHRENIAQNAMMSFQKIINNHSFGIFTGNKKETDADYIFSTIQTIHKQEYRKMFDPDDFDYIIIDEVHRAGANSYQELINYFKPKFMLGMSATPERSDDFDIYQMFDYNIAYEIRLQQAMEYDLLCPFHYYGITDLQVNGVSLEDKSDFNHLTSQSRVDHIIEQINNYGFSGDRVRGLVFCSRKDEAKELSNLFNQRGYKTVALTGEDDENKRRDAMDKLETDDSVDYLDYIFTVDIFNEGIDIPEVNQVIMLRPTESAIVFVQQLGRGLRKDHSKEYVVVIDFIGNYEKNFLIPIALSSNQSYNKDTLRRVVSEGSLLIPGASTINFDRISKKKIFESIDKANFSDIKIIKESYLQLKQKLGRIPSLQDFDKYDSIDVLRIFQNKNLGSYHKFLSKYEKDYSIKFNPIQEQYLAYISTKLASGKRVHELEAIKVCIENQSNIITSLKNELSKQFNIKFKDVNYLSIINQLKQEFATGGAKATFKDAIFIDNNLNTHPQLITLLKDKNFKTQLLEIINFGINRYKQNYNNTYKNTDLCLYQKYTYEDVCRLLEWEKGEVALNIGGYKFDKNTNTYPVFINYDKDENIADTVKYEDHLVSPDKLIAISKSNRTVSSDDVQTALNSSVLGIDMELFIRKNKDDKISKEFYYMGKIIPTGTYKQFVMPNTNSTAVEIEYRLKTPIKEDLYDYIVNS